MRARTAELRRRRGASSRGRAVVRSSWETRHVRMYMRTSRAGRAGRRNTYPLKRVQYFNIAKRCMPLQPIDVYIRTHHTHSVPNLSLTRENIYYTHERERAATLSKLLKPLALLICSPFLRLRTSLSTFHHTIFNFYIPYLLLFISVCSRFVLSTVYILAKLFHKNEPTALSAPERAGTQTHPHGGTSVTCCGNLTPNDRELPARGMNHARGEI